MTARRTLWALRYCAGPHSDAAFVCRVFLCFLSSASACSFRLGGWVSRPAPCRLLSYLASMPSWSPAAQTRLPQRLVAQEKPQACLGETPMTRPHGPAGPRSRRRIDLSQRHARRTDSDVRVTACANSGPALLGAAPHCRRCYRWHMGCEEKSSKRETVRETERRGKTIGGRSHVEDHTVSGKQPPPSAPHPSHRPMTGASPATGDFGSSPPPPARPSATTEPGRACGRPARPPPRRAAPPPPRSPPR